MKVCSDAMAVAASASTGWGGGLEVLGNVVIGRTGLSRLGDVEEGRRRNDSEWKAK